MANRSLTTVSGMLPGYGRSGFEFNLAPAPITTSMYNNCMFSCLTKQACRLSDNIYINTYSDCYKNLVLVQFQEATIKIKGGQLAAILFLNLYIPMFIFCILSAQ